MLKRIRNAAAAALLVVGLVAGGWQTAWAASYPVMAVSTDQAGNASDGSTVFHTQLSADGTKVAFASDASNLDPNIAIPPRTPGTGGPQYVYLKDIASGAVELISKGTNNEFVSESWGTLNYKMTPDAKHVIFATARDIYTGDIGGGVGFLYVRNLETGVTTLANVDSNGDVVPCQQMAISDDGRYVGFTSYPNGFRLFVRDMQAGATTELPVHGESMILSGNGRYLFYNNSDASAVKYRYDLQTGDNIAVSVGEDGSTEVVTNGVVSTSYDGNKVVFETVGALVKGPDRPCSEDPNALRPHLRDIAAGTTVVLDVQADGSDPTFCGGGFDSPFINSAGTKVAFVTTANLAGNPSPQMQVFIKDLATAKVTGVSLDLSGNYLNFGVTTGGYNPAVGMSEDGSLVSYTSSSGNLPAANGYYQAYVTPSKVLPVLGEASWSANPLDLGQNTTLTVPASQVSGDGVAGGEYFVDSDPGVGSATTMNFDGNELSVTFGSALTSGTHTVGVRAVDVHGTWSATSIFELVVNPPDSAPVITSGATASTGMRAAFNHTVTTSGFPAPALSVSGALPAGLTFTDNGDGTADLKGYAAAGTNGTYPLTFTATNRAGSTTQNFTLTVTTATSAPGFISGTAETVEFGQPFTITINTAGYPAPAITKTGSLPNGVTFTDNGDGTATLAGTPAGGALGNYSFIFTARNGISPKATQNFTLTITKAPIIRGITGNIATAGTPYSLTITTRGYTVPTVEYSGNLPAGLTFVDNGDGTATISGTPETGTGGVYPITLTATNQSGTTTKTLNLKVYEAPIIISQDDIGFGVDGRGVFQVETTGYPKPSFSITGNLPASITFNTTSGKFVGKPTAAELGDYHVTVTATNSLGSDTQDITLRVVYPQ